MMLNELDSYSEENRASSVFHQTNHRRSQQDLQERLTDPTGAPRGCCVETDSLSLSSNCCVRLEVLFVGAFVFFFVFARSPLDKCPVTVRDTCLVGSKHAEK
jgi:hypothetical protein